MVKTRTLVVVDDYLDDPDAVRTLALQQDYMKMGSAGLRSSKQFHSAVDPADFEELLGVRIGEDDWDRHAINGRFQYCTSEDPIVYHSDQQRWAGVVFLTPDAPVESGLTLVKSRATGMKKPSSDPQVNSKTYDGKLLDSTKWEPIDVVGNVYNRLVLWDARHIHAASRYFGTTRDDSRLFWMFFFDSKPEV